MRRVNWLSQAPNSVNVTRLDRGILGMVPAASPGVGPNARSGPVQTTEVPFTLVAGVPQIIAAANPWRVGMMLQNKDTVDNLFFSFGPIASALSGYLSPQGTLLLDFICPCDQVSVFATVAISGSYKDFSRSAE